MSSFNTQHPIAKASDRSASAAELASRGLAGFSSNSSTTFHKDSAMRHSHTSRGLRTSAKTLMAVLGLGLATACSDSVGTTPISQVSVQAPAGFDQVVGVQTFTYNPSSGVTQRLGDNVISIPAGAVCKTDQYYASRQWDMPCTAVKHPIVFTATMFSNAAGVPYVTFEPSVRFAPNKEVDLYLRDGVRTTAQVLAIYWCPSVGVACIDESTSDSSLVTQRVGRSSILVRRIKHFSGYSVNVGSDCTDGIVSMLDDGSLWCDTTNGFGGGADRSGYMLASGLTKGGSSGAHRKKYEQ